MQLLLYFKEVSCIRSSTKPETNSELLSKWKNNFIDAMLLRDKSETEKKDLLNKIIKLEDLCNKKEKFLQSAKMIIKFRESHINRLKLADGEKSKMDSPDKNAYIAELQQEISVLQDQLEHHPGITKFAIENQNLRAELKKLQSKEILIQNRKYDEEKAVQLEKLFNDLMMEKQDLPGLESKPSSVGRTPPHSINTVTAAIVEKLKSQIKNQQIEIESTKQEMLEQNEIAKKKQLELESDLASFKKANEELEKIMENQQRKNKLERATLNDIHANTLKIMTTPTKSPAYHLRSRVVKATNDAGGTPLNFEGEDVERNILDETLPAEYYEALTEEVKHLQNVNNELTEQAQDKDSEIIHYKQTTVKLEHQISLFNNLIATERSDWCKKENELSTQINNLCHLLDQMTEESRVYKSEAEDLRLLLHSADREISQNKQEKLETQSSVKELAALQSKIVRLESDVEKLAKDKNVLIEEKECLEGTVDTLDEQIKFQQEIIRELRQGLHDDRQHIKDLETGLQTTLKKLALECEKTVTLEMQLQEEDKEQQQELVKALQDNIGLRTQAADLESLCEEKSRKILQIRTDYESAIETINNLQKELVHQKDAISGMLSNINNQKVFINEQEMKITNLNLELEDSRASYEIILATSEEQKLQLEELHQSIEVMKQSMDQLTSKHEFEMSVAKDELDNMTENYDKLSNEMKNLQNLLESSQNDAELYLQEIKHLKDELANKQLELETLRQEFDHFQNVKTSSHLETAISQGGGEASSLEQIVALRDQEILAYKQNQAQLNHFLEEYEISRKEKNEEIQLLKAQLIEAINYKTDAEIWQTRCQDSQYRLEEISSAAKEKERHLTARVNELQDKLTHTTASYQRATEIIEETLQEKLTLESELSHTASNLEVVQANLEEKIKDLTRIKSMEAQFYEEKEKLRLQLDQVLEEKSKLIKASSSRKMNGLLRRTSVLPDIKTLNRESDISLPSKKKMTASKSK